MIYVFNESNEQIWEITSKNDYFFHIGLIESRFGVDILKRDMDPDNFYPKAFEASEEPKMVMLSPNSFGICYNNKSGLPFLKSLTNVNEYSQDLFLLSYKVPEGMEIVFEKNGKLNILYTKFDMKRGMVHIVATAKPVNIPYYYLTFADSKLNNFVTKHLTTSKKNSSVNIFIQKYTAKEIEESEFKNSIIGKNSINEVSQIKIKPSKVFVPYSVIVYPFSKPNIKTDICEGKYNKDENHTKYADSESKSLISELRKINNLKYRAATFYVDKKFAEIDPSVDLAKVYGANIFDKVNYMTSDGRIISAE